MNETVRASLSYGVSCESSRPESWLHASRDRVRSPYSSVDNGSTRPIMCAQLAIALVRPQTADRCLAQLRDDTSKVLAPEALIHPQPPQIGFNGGDGFMEHDDPTESLGTTGLTTSDITKAKVSRRANRLRPFSCCLKRL